MTGEELEKEMCQCYGTELYHKHPMFPYLYTDGVLTFVDKANALWFLTDAFVYITMLKKSDKYDGFLSLTFKVKDEKAVLEITDGDYKVLKTIKYTHTDCPKGGWQFFFMDNVLMYCREY